MTERVIMVTGAAGYWGRRAASRLMNEPNVHVIGLDREPLDSNIDGLDFVPADLRNPLLVELLAEERVDTIVHLQFRQTLTPTESSFDENVMGAAKLLAAAGEAGVRKIVAMSSLMVYGALPNNPMFMTEDHPLNGTKKYGYVRDWVEMENYYASFREQHPDRLVTVLRFGHIVGPKADTPMTRFLREEEALVLLGFDPMMQFIHETDVVNALIHATLTDADGVFNLAPEKGMPLWKALALASKVPIPVLHPLAYWSVSLGGPRLAPIPLDYLRYPCMGDMSRMTSLLGFTPQYTPEETVREFAAQQRVRKLLQKKGGDGYDEERLRDTIQRRRRAREAQKATRARSKPRRAHKNRPGEAIDG